LGAMGDQGQQGDRDQMDGGRPIESDTARLETFSDGVLAIAITLLILEVRSPHVPAGSSLAHELARQWPSYAAYAVSFLTIGIIWVNHHHMFKVISRSNHTFLMLNVVFLMTIAALPFPTALVADHVHDASSRSVAAFVYGANMVAVSVMFNAVWRYAASGHRLLYPNVDPELVRRVNRSFLFGPLTYSAGMLVALANSWVSLAIYAGLALYWLLPTSGASLDAPPTRVRRDTTRIRWGRRA
jgi:TMEM175 potassium channel family protein